MAETEPVPRRDNPDVSHERSDVNVRVIAAFGVGLVIVAFVIHIALYWLLGSYERSAVRRAPAISPLQAERQIPPPPRLQVSPPTDLAELRAAEEKALRTYGWIDKERKIVRIPIDRAMEILAEKGLPARKAEEKRPAKK